MNDERLIECVRQHVVLYDLSDPKYMDTNVKNEVWAKIGAEMNMDGTSCKNRWYNIRDTFRKSLKRTVTKSGRGPKKVYKYSGQLGFLKRHLEEKESVSNIFCQDLRDEEVSAENICDVQVCEYEEMEDSAHEQELCPPHPAVTPGRASLKLNSARESTPSVLMDYLVSKNKPTAEQHPVDAFLAAMAPTLKALTPYDWHLAKSELFNTVQKYELKNIMAGRQLAGTFDEHVSPSASVNSVDEK